MYHIQSKASYPSICLDITHLRVFEFLTENMNGSNLLILLNALNKLIGTHLLNSNLTVNICFDTFLRFFSRVWFLLIGCDRMHVKRCETYNCHKPIIESVCLSSRRYFWVTLSDRRAFYMIIIEFSFPWNVYMRGNFITKR